MDSNGQQPLQLLQRPRLLPIGVAVADDGDYDYDELNDCSSLFD